MRESETLELKRSTSGLKEAVISIASMLNKHGKGELYFGIKNDGSVVGQQISEKTMRQVSQAISNHIEPKIFPRVEKEVISEKECLHVNFEGDQGPYYAYGRVYMRVGDEDRLLTPNEIERLIIEKNEDKQYWDILCTRSGPESVIEETLIGFMNRANESGRVEFEYTGRDVILDKLGLLENGKLRNAGEVLFSKHCELEVQMAIFAGRDKTTFLDIKRLTGNIFELLKKSELYLKSNMRWGVKFGKLEREEVPEIPLKALREALVNSLCHRDYRNPKGNEIAIFNDRIEIYNPGRFPEGLTPEDYIKGEERSVLRNPLIANTLYLSQDIEKWGSGLKRIYEECKSQDVGVDFKTIKTGFLTVFQRRAPPSEELGDGLGDGLVDRLVEGLVNGLAENQKRILALVANNPYISMKEMAKIIGISTTAIDKNTATLKKKGLLRRKGSAKGGYWEVVR